MSEMKPKFWIAKADFASLSDEDDGCDALHQCATVSRDGCKLLPDDVPLYTEEKLAEAVAAERERILRTHNISTEDDLFWYFDDREYGHNDASELLQANEFEIVHIATGRNTGEMFGFSSGNDHHFFKTEAEAEAAIEAIRSAAK